MIKKPLTHVSGFSNDIRNSYVNLRKFFRSVFRLDSEIRKNVA